MRKKIMIVGSGYNFCSLVNAAKKNNISVIVCDGQVNGKARKLADAFYYVNITDINLLKEIAEREKVNGIITSFSDITLIPYIQLSTKMGFSTLFEESYLEKFIDKQEMKKTFVENDILSPNYQLVKDIHDKICLNYPLVAKPLRSSGSKGIFFINKYEDLRKNYDNIINNGNFKQDNLLVEEKIQGDEILIQAWIENEMPYMSYIGDRILYYPFGNRPGQTNYNIFPSKYLNSKREEFYNLVKKVSTAFKIKKGILSIQAVIDEQGRVFVLEVMPRLTGGQEHLIQLQKTGVDMCEIMVKYAVDDSSYLEDLKKIRLTCEKDEYYFFVPLMCEEGTINEILLEEQYEKHYVTYIDTQVEIGEVVKSSGDMRQIKARIHGVAKSRQEVIERVNMIRKDSKILDENKKNMIRQVEAKISL